MGVGTFEIKADLSGMYDDVALLCQWVVLKLCAVDGPESHFFANKYALVAALHPKKSPILTYSIYDPKEGLRFRNLRQVLARKVGWAGKFEMDPLWPLEWTKLQYLFIQCKVFRVRKSWWNWGHPVPKCQIRAYLPFVSHAWSCHAKL